MAKPFFERLNRYYTHIGKVLRAEADVVSIFPNGADVGYSREHFYAEMLFSNLPANCDVVFGGFLFNKTGDESKQIDILIVNDAALRFSFLGIRLGDKAGQLKNGLPFPPNSYLPILQNPDVFAIHYALSNMQHIASACRYILYDYEDVLWEAFDFASQTAK